jgi:hypothetical protein
VTLGDVFGTASPALPQPAVAVPTPPFPWVKLLVAAAVLGVLPIRSSGWLIFSIAIAIVGAVLLGWRRIGWGTFTLLIVAICVAIDVGIR